MPEQKMCPFQRRTDIEVRCRDTCALWQKGKCTIAVLVDELGAVNDSLLELLHKKPVK